MVKVLLFLIPFYLWASTYPIAERDVLDELEAKKPQAYRAFKKQIKESEEKIKALRGEELPASKTNYSYWVDQTYVLEQDIPRVDTQGRVIGILYPKGFAFNPLAYMPIMPTNMIVFDPSKKKEVAIVKALLAKNTNYKLLTTNCPLEKWNMHGVNRQMFRLTKEIKERANIKSTPSVIRFDKQSKRILVEVYKTID